MNLKEYIKIVLVVVPILLLATLTAFLIKTFVPSNYCLLSIVAVGLILGFPIIKYIDCAIDNFM